MENDESNGNKNNNEENIEDVFEEEDKEGMYLKEDNSQDEENDKNTLVFELGDDLYKENYKKNKKRKLIELENDVTKFYESLLISREPLLKDY